jgi:hypothetical protein
MYGEGKKAGHPNDAAAFMQEATKSEAVTQERFMAGYKVLENFKFTDPGRIAAIGYCFGGGTVLKMALSGMDLAFRTSSRNRGRSRPRSWFVTAPRTKWSSPSSWHHSKSRLTKPELIIR